jgi:hypothetical protein
MLFDEFLEQLFKLVFLLLQFGGSVVLDLLFEVFPPLGFSLDSFFFFVISILEVVDKFLGPVVLLLVPQLFPFLSPFFSFFAVLFFEFSLSLELIILQFSILFGFFLQAFFCLLSLLFGFLYFFLEHFSFLCTPGFFSFFELFLTILLVFDGLQSFFFGFFPLGLLLLSHIAEYLLLKRQKNA